MFWWRADPRERIALCPDELAVGLVENHLPVPATTLANLGLWE